MDKKILKKVLLVLSILFIILTFAGAVYVLLNIGKEQEHEKNGDALLFCVFAAWCCSFPWLFGERIWKLNMRN